MATIVVPFRSGGKTRLPEELRLDVALAMLGDVLEAATAQADRVRLVTGDRAAIQLGEACGVEIVSDPAGGQGAAVEAALAGVDGVCLVVNADVPRVRPADLAALAFPPRTGALSLVAAADGTTNALGLPFAEVFRPLYGRDSAARFRRRAHELGLVLRDLELPNLRDDVDTADDLERIAVHAGARTRALTPLLRT